MNGRIASILVASLLAFGLGAGARADDKPMTTAEGITGEADVKMTKHLALVDVYIESAIDNTKALAMLADMEIDRKDRPMLQELRRNLSGSLDKAITHLGRVEKQHAEMGGELSMHLKEARAAAKKIKVTGAEELATSIDPVETHLTAAETSFRDLAKELRYTMLDDFNLGGVPVRGTEQPGETKPEHEPGEPGEEAPLPPPAAPPPGGTKDY